MKARVLKLILATTAFAFTLSACSDTEAPASHSTPESVKLFDAATHTELPQPYALVSGATTRVEVHYYDADGDDISDELIAEHFTSLTFDPGTFVDRVLRYRREVPARHPRQRGHRRHGRAHGRLRTRRGGGLEELRTLHGYGNRCAGRGVPRRADADGASMKAAFLVASLVALFGSRVRGRGTTGW